MLKSGVMFEGNLSIPINSTIDLRFTDFLLGCIGGYTEDLIVIDFRALDKLCHFSFL